MTKYQLPAVTLTPGASITIYGSKNATALGDYIADFALADGETLTLSDAAGNILDVVYVPDHSSLETYRRYDHSATWVYQLLSTE